MLLNILFSFFSILSIKSDISPAFTFSNETDYLSRYKNLLIDIREEKISPIEAEMEFKSIMRFLKEEFPNSEKYRADQEIVFPLIKSSISAVGGKGRGFYDRKYNMFDHAVTGSHPAHDIFIFDPDHDCIDNRKNEYVDVVSVSHGIVLAVEKDWTDSSDYRGGNYVWVYDFERGGLWYYAHERKVVVVPGQIVQPGNKLGEVGRTGFNALNKRSDTHLHLMFLELDETFYPWPVNYYEWLKNAEFLTKSTKAEILKRDILKINRIRPKSLKRIETKQYNLKVDYKKKTEIALDLPRKRRR
ncbi:M23 family metallopeptidase [Lacihabitans sp. LS3-19]|uniref:M23 family metallopeptidase n=1 Tax=Lacihabitans sp. LS3-19 TaxID=2487335 RepID=UPI0020CF4754|nr:M23 family metallopeptidase [Lacihabitans sp. LS3-19]MCP9766914.1 M23 family metallopeptidase [Lacihabitans sp. LS3-19]